MIAAVVAPAATRAGTRGEPLQGTAQVGVGPIQHQGNMLLHPREAVQTDAKTPDHFRDDLEEMLPVPVIPRRGFWFTRGVRDANGRPLEAQGPRAGNPH